MFVPDDVRQVYDDLLVVNDAQQRRRAHEALDEFVAAFDAGYPEIDFEPGPEEAEFWGEEGLVPPGLKARQEELLGFELAARAQGDEDEVVVTAEFAAPEYPEAIVIWVLPGNPHVLRLAIPIAWP